MRRRRPGTGSAVTAAAAAALLLAAGCQGPAPDGPRHIILISVDTLRPDRLGCWGDPDAWTPFWDRLARSGVQFRKAFSSAPFTLPSHTTMLTGAAPPRHGARANGLSTADPAIETLAETLAARGFHCGAFLASAVLDSTSGMQAGFERYEWQDRPGQLERAAPQVTRSAARWMESLGTDRFFLFLHLYDPHDPYRPPPPWDRLPLEPYDAEIAATDRALVAFSHRLEAAGILDDALVIALSDHGEAFGAHGEYGHGFFIYNTTLRIPLVISSPEVFRGGGIRSDLARTRDVRETVLATLGIGTGGLAERSGDEPPTAYAETFEPALRHEASDLRSLREGRWKYIRAPREELYDLVADPGETRNLASREAEIAAELRTRLETRLGDDLVHPKGLSDAEPLDEERIAELEALGYVAAGPGVTDLSGTRDPKDLVGIVDLLDQVGPLERAGDWDALADLARRIQAKDPRNPTSWRLLAGERFARGTPEEGIAVWEAAVREVPDSGALWGAYGGELLRLGRAEEARGALREAVRQGGGTPAVRLQLAIAALQTGLPRVAWKEVDAVLAEDPENAGARRLAEQLETQGVPRPADLERPGTP